MLYALSVQLCNCVSVRACERGCENLSTYVQKNYTQFMSAGRASHAHVSVCSFLRVVLKTLYHPAAGSNHLEIQRGLQGAPRSRNSPSIHGRDNM